MFSQPDPEHPFGCSLWHFHVPCNVFLTRRYELRWSCDQRSLSRRACEPSFPAAHGQSRAFARERQVRWVCRTCETPSSQSYEGTGVPCGASLRCLPLTEVSCGHPQWFSPSTNGKSAGRWHWASYPFEGMWRALRGRVGLCRAVVQ